MHRKRQSRKGSILSAVLVFLSVFFLAVSAETGMQAGLKTVEVLERYSQDTSSGYYFPEGKIGSALAVFTGNPLVYPVFFSKTCPEEGTLSFWFKVMRNSGYDAQNLLDLKNAGGVSLYTPDGRNRTLRFPGGQKIIENDFCNSFHHILFTWNTRKEATYLNGQKVYEKEYPVNHVPERDMSKATLTMHSSSGSLIDEVVILDTYTSEENVPVFSLGTRPWQIDANTVFYADFDGSIKAKGTIKRGDVLRVEPYIGRVDATFLKGERAEFLFRVLNTHGDSKDLILKGVVRDINKKTVLEQSMLVKASAASIADVRFKMDGIKDNGLFWGVFTLYDGSSVIEEKIIPFAKTLALHARDCKPDEMRTGFTAARAGNPPAYQKWSLIHYDGWDTLEPVPGQWYFDRLDMKVDSHLAAGTVPIIMLSSPPEWYKQTYKSRGYHGYYYPDTDDPEAMKHWKNYVRTVGERYRGRVFDYEIFGEAYGRSDPRHYGRLVAIAAEVLHGIDPRIEVACNMGGYHDWATVVARETAGHADYYTIHPYNWVCGEDNKLLGDELYADSYTRILKEVGAKTKLANTEYGAYQPLTLAVHPDGYPMTKEEFDKFAKSAEMPEFFTKRGRSAFTDWYTTAFRAVRGHTMNLAVDAKYALWWSSVGGGMISDLQFARHTPSPASVAYANVSGILAGHVFAGKIDLGSSYTKAYLFRKGGHYTLVAFTDDPDRESQVYVEAGGRKIQILNHYGNPVSYERAGSMLKLRLNPLTPLYVTGITRMPAESKPVLKTDNPDHYAYPGTESRIRVRVYNPLRRTLNGSLGLNLPGPFAAVPSQTVTIRPGEQKEVFFDVKIPISILTNQEIETVFSTEAREMGAVRSTETLFVRASVIAVPATNPVVIDGDLEEWENISRFPIAIDDPEQVIRGIPYTKLYMMDQRFDWAGPGDLSARIAVKYDTENLYIAARVWDNVVMNLTRKSPIYIYEGDGLEIFIDGRDPGSMGSNVFLGNVYHIKLAPCTGPGQPPFHHISKPQRDMEIPGLDYASRLLEDGYTFEVKIPFKSAFPSLTPKPGLRMGLAFHLNDQDEKGFGEVEGAKAKTTMLWGGAKGVSGDPSKFGTLILGGR